MNWCLCVIISCLLFGGVKAQIKDESLTSNNEVMNSLLKAHLTGSAKSLLLQNPNWTNNDLFNRLLEVGKQHYFADDYERAKIYFEVAEVVATHLGNKDHQAESLHQQGVALYAQGEISKAVEKGLAGLELAESKTAENYKVYILKDLSVAYRSLGDIDKARNLAEQSLNLGEKLNDKRAVAFSLLVLGSIDKLQDEYSKARIKFNKCLSLFKELNDRKYAADTLMQIGTIENIQGNYRHALMNFAEAYEIYKELKARDRIQDAILNLGYLYLNQGDFSSADSYFQESLEISQILNNKTAVARTLLALGVSRREQNQHDEARRVLNKSYELSDKSNIKAIKLGAASELAILNEQQQQYQEAAKYLDISKQIGSELGISSFISSLLWLESRLAYEQGEYKKAVDLSKKAAILAVNVNETEVFYSALTTQGRALLANGEYDAAEAALHAAIAEIENMRERTVDDELGQKFLERSLLPYHVLFEMSVKRNDVLKALSLAERAKGRVLFDVITRGRLSIDKTISPEKRAEEKKLNEKIAILNKEVVNENGRDSPDAQRLVLLTEELGKARRAYEMFRIQLYAAHPTLKVKRGDLSHLTSSQIERLVPNDSAALEYVVTNREVYLVALSKSTTSKRKQLAFNVYPLKTSPEELSQMVHRFRASISDRQIGIDRSAQKMYDLLIKPAESHLAGKRTLIIVPDGALWQLPFQALYNNNRYLIENHAVFLVQSLSVLQEMKKNQRVKAQENSPREIRRFTAFANPSLMTAKFTTVVEKQRGKKLVPLPETEAQAETEARMYGETSVVYKREDAREERAKLEAGRSRVVEFNTHGFLDSFNPMYSYLVLAQGAQDASDDGLLEAREIIDLDLSRTELAVLSACDTGLGRVGRGEGIIGMSWAFFVAGCPSLIATQWEVDSLSTSKQMVEFHRNYVALGKQPSAIPAKAAALQRANLKLLSSPIFNHPYYWAGLSVIGNPY